MTDASHPRPRPPTIGKETATGLLLKEAGTVMEPRGYSLQLNEIKRRRSQLAESPKRVVVVGELSAGKSSIVNVLLGGTGFSPVGAKETTRVSLRFIPPSEFLPAGTVRLDLDGEYKTISRDELADWVTVSGAHADTVEAEKMLGVDIGQDSSELPGATIVDTPGSGGLSRSHAKRALTSAAGAGILLIITEADGRLTKKTLHFLREAADYAGWIIVVMNKIDQKREWKQILDEDTAIMREQQFPPAAFVGVSALWAGKALTEENDREGYRRISQIDGLLAALEEPLKYAVRIPDLSALRQLHRLIEAAAADLAAGLAIITEPEEAVKQLAARQEDLNKIRAGQRHWQKRIGKGINELRMDATSQTRRTIKEFEEEWHQKASSTFGKSTAQARNLQLQMADEVKDIELAIADILTIGTKNVIQDLFTSAHLPVPHHLNVIDFDAIEKPNLRTMFDTGGKVGMIAGALSLARPAIALGPSLGPYGIPVIAVGVAGGFMLTTRMKNSRELQQRITDHTRVITEELADAIGQASSHLNLVVSEAFEDAVRDAQDDIDAKIKDARHAISESARERSTRRKEHETSMKAYLELNRKALAEMNRLRGNLGPRSSL